jgi:S-adenosylmethionine decarboxylase
MLPGGDHGAITRRGRNVCQWLATLHDRRDDSRYDAAVFAQRAQAAPSVGTEWLVDAWGCDPARLADPTRLRALCEEIVGDLALHVIGELWHPFPPPGGVTAMYLLSESHLTCHTWPEAGVATFNLSCCRPRPAWDWRAKLAAHLGATSVEVRSVIRGAAGAE